MKKFTKLFLVLAMILSMSLTVFADIDEDYELTATDKETLIAAGDTVMEDVISGLDGLTANDIEYYIGHLYGDYVTLYQSYYDMYTTVGEIEDYSASDCTYEDGKFYLTYELTCENGTGTLTLTFAELTIGSTCSLTDAGTTVAYINGTFTTGTANSEEASISTAVLNTAMGLFTVFMILVVIMFIISLLQYVNKIPELFKSKEKPEYLDDEDDFVARVEQNESNEMDNMELIAIITAAIAMETGASPDNFVVRKIKRR